MVVIVVMVTFALMAMSVTYISNGENSKKNLNFI